jgi:hypothetical protein
MSEMCHNSAAFCMNVPEKDTSSPNQISRKFRYCRATSDEGQRELNRDALRSGASRAIRYLTSRSSISKISVEFAGIPVIARFP